MAEFRSLRGTLQIMFGRISNQPLVRSVGVFAVWLGCITAAAAQLPPDVLMDKYLLQAEMLREEKNHKGALEAMDRIVALEEEHGLTLPEAFSFQYAQTALAAGSVQAAIDSANQYLSVAGRESKHYRQALELLLNAERKVMEPDVDRAETGAAEPEVEPQFHSVSPSPREISEPTEAPQVPGCEGWNTRKFFDNTYGFAGAGKSIDCLKAGADAMARDHEGRTPLHNASRLARYRSSKVLLEAGANIEAKDNDGETPLYYAMYSPVGKAKRALEKQVKVLLAAGADVSARDYKGRTPLHAAATRISQVLRRSSKVLLEAGANIEAKDNAGRTPLHTAASEGSGVEVLLKAGANMGARDHEGRTPLHSAAGNVHGSNIKKLLKAGADLEARDNLGRTPLDIARSSKYRKGFPGVVKALTSAESARLRRKGHSAPGLLEAAIGIAGGTAIAAAGGGTEEALAAGTVFAESVIGGQQTVGNTGGGISSVSSNPGEASNEFREAWRNLENSCGEKYRSRFSDQDHGRFYCLDAFARHCALKKGDNKQHFEALRHDFEALRALGGAERCPYFSVLGGTYNENQTIPKVPERVTEHKPVEPVAKKRPLPTCADGSNVPIAVAEGRKPGCPPERWCRWDACLSLPGKDRTYKCDRRFPECVPGVLN